MFKKLIDLLSGATTKAASTRHTRDSGHWQCPLDGHGLSYLDELVACYRTLPALTASEQKALEAAKAAYDKAREAGEAYAKAADAAEAARNDAEVNPSDQAKQNLAATEANEAAKTKTDLNVANQAAVQAQAALIPRPAAAQIIQELISRPREKLLWSDVLLFESALLRMLPSEDLRARLVTLREDYQRVVGALPSISRISLDLKETVDPLTEKALRAEAGLLISEVHWGYLTHPVIERQKTKMTTNLFWVTIVWLSLWCLFWIWRHSSIWPAVVIAGALGAALSAFQRLQSPQLRTDAFLNLRHSPWHTISFLVAPILGSISAGILALMFAGGLFRGSLFPDVGFVKPSECTNGVSQASGPAGQTNATPTPAPPGAPGQTAGAPAQPGVAAAPPPAGAPPAATDASKPSTNPPAAITNGTNKLTIAKDTNNPTDGTKTDPCPNICSYCWCLHGNLSLALLLIWSFIAGFSERLVPDILTRLTARARETG
jgi:hypothetical protein